MIGIIWFVCLYIATYVFKLLSFSILDIFLLSLCGWLTCSIIKDILE